MSECTFKIFLPNALAATNMVRTPRSINLKRSSAPNARRWLRIRGVELIDMGVGEPDEMAFPSCIEALAEESAKPENRGYADNGGPEYKTAAAHWLKEVCGVDGIDPETEVMHSIGSKGALTVLPHCFITPVMWH